MSLHTYDNVEQGTEEWDDLRRGIVTASVVGQLITAKTLKPADNDYSRGLTDRLVAERINGWTEPTWVNADMQRGIDDEPRARDLYSEKYEPVTEVGFQIRDDWGFSIGFSPDGLVGDEGLIECKSRRPRRHLHTILANEVPQENIAQIQCGLLVSGRSWCDYLSYAGGMPLWRKRVTPDLRWFDAIITAVTQFEATAEDMIAQYNAAVEGLPMTERPLDLDRIVI